MVAISTIMTTVAPADSPSSCAGPPSAGASQADVRLAIPKPTENPATTRGRWAFNSRTSSRRPAWAPTIRKPSGIDNGNSTSNANVTQMASVVVRISQPPATRTRYADKIDSATATTELRAWARRMTAETTTPDAATAR